MNKAFEEVLIERPDWDTYQARDEAIRRVNQSSSVDNDEVNKMVAEIQTEHPDWLPGRVRTEAIKKVTQASRMK